MYLPAERIRRYRKMKIIICDDCEEEIVKSKRVILTQKLAEEKDVTTCQPEELLRQIRSQALQCDLFIMDIEFDGRDYNGITLSAAINELLPESQIIYLTNILEFAPEVYETKHCYFVLKANMELMLPRAVRKAEVLIQKRKKNSVLEIFNQGSKVIISQNEILYIERAQRKLQIHTKEKEYSYYSSLRKLQGQLDEVFVRCHEAYIVNLDYVKVVEKEQIQMENSDIIPIGVSYEKELRRRYLNYWAEQV